jgi:L-lysine 2,3-aminomutase
VPFLVHRYPDRVLLLAKQPLRSVLQFSALSRKEVGKIVDIKREHMMDAFRYIAKPSGDKDVLCLRRGFL